MLHKLERYKPIADAITLLFQPNAEVVIHDTIRDQIFHISNPSPGRQNGNPSYLESSFNDIDISETILGPYENAGRSGQRVRSVTVVLRDDTKKYIGLMCINLDFSRFEPALELLESLIRPPADQQPPEILFQNDWREQIKFEIRHFLETHKMTLQELTPKKRKMLLAVIDRKRLLFAKNSVAQVASILNISRATAYNDLKEIRSMQSHYQSQ